MYVERKARRAAGDCVFVVWGLAMHLVLLGGVLDANFHSPILRGLPPVSPPIGAPAKRLLLFVADGLRFRTFADDPPPYLRSLTKSEGVWGVSHTRVPTESRPGNVAIVAGLYEDPNALFKGWKENPVDFDTVFNRSRETRAWGSPDIIPMFVKGCEGKVYGESYPSDWQDFEGKGTIRLDAWVFDGFFRWIEEAAKRIEKEDRVIMFLHLLGCDTAGHSSKPHSAEYAENMKFVDRKIEEVVRKVEATFEPGSTAYVFTADHGMTDWGSHGSGSADETETPLVVWGAGVGHLETRQDVEQADIAPLIASLLGISIPVNSEGVLPRRFLRAANESYGARALLSNAKQLALQVRANRAASSGGRSHWREAELDRRIGRTELLLGEGRLAEAIEEGERAIFRAKESLVYFRRYQRDRLVLYLTLMWLGWIGLLFLRIVGIPRRGFKPVWLLLTNVGFFVAAILLLVEHRVSDSRGWRSPVYGSLALLSLWLACRGAIRFSPSVRIPNDRSSYAAATGLVFLLVTMWAGLTHRWVLSVGTIVAAIMQRIFLEDSRDSLTWTAVVLAIFPSLPVVEPKPRTHVVLASLAVAAFAVAANKSTRPPWKLLECLRLACTATLCAGYVDGRRWLSWLLLLGTPLCVWTYPRTPKERIAGVVFGLLCPLALLSTSYEPFFLLALAAHLLAWPLPVDSTRPAERLRVEDVAKAAFLMLYTLLCFFGTGNMASLSSFDPLWTRHFVTIFSPFTMAALILFKLSVPLIVVGCASRALASVAVFPAALLLGDCLSLPLMHGVTSHGSWLDIGSAISRFTIAITLPCLLLLLRHLSYPLVAVGFGGASPQLPRKEHLV